MNDVSKKLFDCFPTLDSYALSLNDIDTYQERDGQDFAKKDCKNVSKLTMHHVTSQVLGHLYWDLQMITDSLQENSDLDFEHKTLLVVRTEFMWNDFFTANRFLGQEGRSMQHASMRNSSEFNNPVSNELSEEGRRTLCLALKREYQVYIKMLKRAENLSKEDISRSLELARANCPWLELM